MVDRRGFLKGSAAAVAGIAGAGAISSAVSGCAPAPASVAPRGLFGEAGIDHVVVVMMENRSFDHFLGWLPGADGMQAGLEFVDTKGVSHETHRLTQFASCEFADPDHSYHGGRTQYHDGANDGFLTTSPDTFPIGYYQQDELPFWAHAAPEFTVCDNYFAATMGPTFPNRFYQHCGRSDRWENWLTISSLPTIWDRVQAAGMEGRYYYSDVPFAALLGVRHTLISRTFQQFEQDCAAGLLPHVSFVDPKLFLPNFGTSGDYHPPSDIRLGEAFLHRVYEAVTTSPAWDRTVMVVNFDEWGGFYDHVPPPRVVDDTDPASVDHSGDSTTATDGQLIPNYQQLGFRVPAIVISNLAERGVVHHGPFEHTSTLRLIESTFGLRPLTARDANAQNLRQALRGHHRRPVPQGTIPTSSQVLGPADGIAGYHSRRPPLAGREASSRSPRPRSAASIIPGTSCHQGPRRTA
jgi:phospholipase C